MTIKDVITAYVGNDIDKTIDVLTLIASKLPVDAAEDICKELGARKLPDSLEVPLPEIKTNV